MLAQLGVRTSAIERQGPGRAAKPSGSLRAPPQRRPGARKALSQLRFIASWGLPRSAGPGAAFILPATRQCYRRVVIGAVPVNIVQSVSEKFNAKGLTASPAPA